MSIETAAKELSRTFTTAGLSKDVIDLLEKKLALVTQKIALLETENARLKLENGQLRTQSQNSQPVIGGFHEFGGVLWKRTAKGFEKFPYCKECAHHPVMMAQPPMQHITPMFWSCSHGHNAPYSGRPEN